MKRNYRGFTFKIGKIKVRKKYAGWEVLPVSIISFANTYVSEYDTDRFKQNGKLLQILHRRLNLLLDWFSNIQ